MAASSSDTVAVLGGGISGLSVAWYLKKRGIKVTLFEVEKETGGVIHSQQNKYSVFDFGPNTVRDTTGSISTMIADLGLEDEVLTMSEASKTRYIVRNGELKKIDQNPFSFLFSDVLSWRGKKELFTEPLKKGLKSDTDESIGSFLERRIGKEAVQYLVDPFFSGIYAGDVYSMSKHKLIGKLSDFEQEYGSVFKGFLKNRSSKSGKNPQVISFKKGVQQLTNSLTSELSEQIKFEEVQALKFVGSEFQINTSQNEYSFNKVISCLPAFALGKALDDQNRNLKQDLLDISYPSMISTQLVFRKEDLTLPEKGFGFLVPRKEGKRLLGAIWKTNIFPEQTSEDFIHVNLMTGGAHDAEISESEVNTIEKEVLVEFLGMMRSEASPVIGDSKLWNHSIPQFKVGHLKIDEAFNKFETDHKGFHIGGNYRWGISVSDCIEGAKKISEFI